MNKAKRLVVIFTLLISACSAPDGFLTVIDTTDISFPIFCLSTKPDCHGDSLHYNSAYTFDEITDNGNYVRTMWSISQKSIANVSIKKFKYGAVPDGWLESQEAKPMEVGKHYRIGGVFVFTCNGPNSCEVFSMKEFYDGRK